MSGNVILQYVPVLEEEAQAPRDMNHLIVASRHYHSGVTKGGVVV